MVRNYVENLIRNQSIRIAEDDISVYEMNLITTKDIEAISVLEYENDFNLEEKLKYVVANEKAKEFLRNQYKVIKAKEKRDKLGLKNEINKYMNIVFTGEIGTGKKMILNILSEMYYSRGIIKAKSVVEIDKIEIDSMINDGMQIEDILNKFIGKVVLIDKADLLIKHHNYNELISSLIKFIDKNKNKIIIVLCGNENEMKNLVQSNSSLSYRFPMWLDFKDYNEYELFDISVNLIKNKGFTIENDAKNYLKDTISEFYKNKDLSVKNAIMVKKYLDKLVRIQSIRVYDEKLSSKEINTINSQDILNSKDEFLKENRLVKVYKNNDNISYKTKDTYSNEIPEIERNYIDNSNNLNIIDEIFKLKNLLDLKLINNDEFNKIKSNLIENIKI